MATTSSDDPGKITATGKSPQQVEGEAQDHYLFKIFAEMEETPLETNATSPSTSESTGMTVGDLRNMMYYFMEGDKFIKKLKSDTLFRNVQLDLKLKKQKSKLRSKTKEKESEKEKAGEKESEQDKASEKENENQDKDTVKLKSYPKEFLKSAVRLQIVKNRLEKIKGYKLLYDDFVKTIEDAGSPQQLDLYISSIEAEQTKLIGNPPANENPVMMKKLIRYLEAKRKEAIYKEKMKGTLKGDAVGVITSPKAKMPLRILATYLPNELEAWVHDVSADELLQVINEAKGKYHIAYQKVIESGDVSQRVMLINQIKLLDQMIDYAENSKHNFDRRLNFSSAMQTAASICSLLSTTVSSALLLVPGANLIAEGFKKTFEFFSYSTLIAAQVSDPNASPEVTLAARRHYEAIKRYNLVETILAGTGTLSLATAAIIPAVATVALPVAPALLFLGATTLLASNVLSSYTSYVDYKHNQKMLRNHPLYSELGELRKRAAQRDKKLTKEQKAILRDEHHTNELKARVKSRVASSFGSGLATVLAGAVLAASIGFPPFGAAVATILTVATIATATYAVYQRHKEKKLAKASYKMNEEIQSEEIRRAIETIKPEIGASKPKVGASPHPESTPQVAPLLHTERRVQAETSLETLTPSPQSVEQAPESAPESSESPAKAPILHAAKHKTSNKEETSLQQAVNKAAPIPDRSANPKSPEIPERPANKQMLIERHRHMLEQKKQQEPAPEIPTPHSPKDHR